MRRISIILCAALILTLAGCSRCKTPEEAATGMYKAIQDHEYEKAVGYTNATDKNKYILLKTFKSLEYNKIIEYNVLDTYDDLNDSTASVVLELVTLNDNSPDTLRDDIDVPCIKQGNNWKVRVF